MPINKTAAEQREIEEKIRSDNQSLVDEVLDEQVYLGGDPEEEEAREEACDKIEEQRLNDETSVSRQEYNDLLERLRANEEYVKKLHGSSLDDIIHQDREKDKERLRRALYDRIRAAGGTCRIQLHTTDSPGGNSPVPVNHNGRAFSLPRGVPVEIPVEVLEVLDHATVSHYRPEIQPDGTSMNIPHNFERFPYTAIDGFHS